MNLLDRMSDENRLKLATGYGNNFPTLYKNLIIDLESTEYFTELPFGSAADLCTALDISLDDFCLLFIQK